jgi:hypothetical protein
MLVARKNNSFEKQEVFAVGLNQILKILRCVLRRGLPNDLRL